MAILAWFFAAALVIGAQRCVGDDLLCIVSKVAAVLVIAFAYIRIARRMTIDRALAAGAAWIALSIVAEVIVASSLGHGWFQLLGSPEHPIARTVLIATWLFAPALFVTARGE